MWKFENSSQQWIIHNPLVINFHFLIYSTKFDFDIRLFTIMWRMCLSHLLVKFNKRWAKLWQYPIIKIPLCSVIGRGWSLLHPTPVDRPYDKMSILQLLWDRSQRRINKRTFTGFYWITSIIVCNLLRLLGIDLMRRSMYSSIIVSQAIRWGHRSAYT